MRPHPRSAGTRSAGTRSAGTRDGRLPAVTRRVDVLRTLESETFDLVVIGGGITGAALAREAARIGLSVSLLEADDFASGTSSRSTKLIHGGLRYLAQGEVGLVRETARERKAIHRIAPHLAEPLWMVLPARRYPEWIGWRTAISAYERLGQVAADDVHRNWRRADLELEEPMLAERFRYATAYREYRTDDARLVLANLRAAAAGGACVVNHARVLGACREDPGVWSVESRCAVLDVTTRVRARCVVNAAGPWADGVRRLAGGAVGGWLHLTRGIHVGLPSKRLPIRHMSMLRARDGRLVFAIPRESIVYVGTTDTTHAPGAETWPVVPHGEVEYLLDAVRRHFGVPPVDVGEVVSAWAGLRPLVAQPGRSPSRTSRRDEVVVGPEGFISIAGGKLTGYRPMARLLLERVCDVLGVSGDTSPSDEPLPGGDFGASLSVLASELATRCQIDRQAADRLVRLYGAESSDVIQMGAARLAEATPVLDGEVDWAVQCEGAVHLQDVFYRRTRAGLYQADATACLEAMAVRMGKLLCWTDAERRAQVAAVRARREADLAFRHAPRARA